MCFFENGIPYTMIQEGTVQTDVYHLERRKYMAVEDAVRGLKERLEDFIKISLSGKTVRIEVKIYQKIISPVSRSEPTDDTNIATNMCLLMADFRSVGGPEMVTKVYAICPMNENEVDAKTTRQLANQRLKMDYDRLKEANIIFQEKYF